MSAEDIRELAGTLPTEPGVYLFKDAGGKTVYVGKAKRIRDRVRSHLSGGHDPVRQGRMLEEAVDVECIVTSNEVEALALENSLIKQSRPKFNVLLRDDKNYPYLRLTRTERFPRLQLVRGMEQDRDVYFGPFIPNSRARLMQVLVYRTFGVRPCNIDIDGSWDRPCLYYDIGECAGPCVQDLCDEEEYAEVVEQAQLFLQGRGEDLADELEAKMQEAAEAREYERAAHYRDLLETVRAHEREQKMASRDVGDRDVFAFHRDGGRAALQAFLVRRGLVVERKQFFWDDVGGIDDDELLATSLQQYYHGGTPIPPEICVPIRPADAEVLLDWLREERDGAVRLHLPQRGAKRRLLDLVADNARLAFAHRYEKRGDERGAERLQELLDLDAPPRVIRCIDVSSIQGAQVVASLVSLKDGEFEKSAYKRFRIRELDRQDDFASIAQVVRRYFLRVQDGDVEAPDLLLVDGGRGQLGAAVAALRELGMQGQPLAAIEKGEEKLYVPGRRQPVRLDDHPEALRLVQRVRDEAHRFAVTYHRSLRSRSTFRSRLDDVPGVGPKRRRRLLTRFGSLRGVREASEEELADEVGPTLAGRIRRWLREGERGGPE